MHEFKLRSIAPSSPKNQRELKPTKMGLDPLWFELGVLNGSELGLENIRI